MRIIATTRADQNRAAVDPWSAVHFSTGLAMGLMNVDRAWAIGASLGYEIVEQFVERKKWGRELFETKGPETPVNSAVDTVVFIAGHWLGKRWLRT